jgi:hypothetical protein
VIFLQEILLLRIEKSFLYIALEKCCALPHERAVVDSARAPPTLVSRLKMQDKCRPPPSSLGLSSKLHVVS